MRKNGLLVLLGLVILTLSLGGCYKSDTTSNRPPPAASAQLNWDQGNWNQTNWQ
jgi:hypothetical protein